MHHLALFALVVAPQVAQVEPALEHELGSPDGGPEESFGWVSDVATDPAGNVYVLDQRADQVRVYDASGAYVSAFGRRGRNLGDLSRPISIDVRGETVTVLNPSGQVNDYSLTGELLRSEAMPFGAQSAIRIAEGRYAVLSEGGISRQGPEPIESLLLVEAGASDTLLVVPSRDLLYRAPTATSSIGTSLCGVAHFAVGADGVLWVASGMDGTLNEWRMVDGVPRVNRSVGVATAAVPLPDSLRALVLDQLPSQIDAGSEDLYVPSVLSFVCGLERAPDGTLWVRLQDESESERWVAVDAETLDLSASMTFAAGVSIKAFGGGRAVGVRVDETNVPHVMVYRLD